MQTKKASESPRFKLTEETKDDKEKEKNPETCCTEW
jgi:hypothetical protein